MGLWMLASRCSSGTPQSLLSTTAVSNGFVFISFYLAHSDILLCPNIAINFKHISLTFQDENCHSVSVTVQSVMFKLYVINYLWFQKYGIIIRLMCPARSQLFYCTVTGIPTWTWMVVNMERVMSVYDWLYLCTNIGADWWLVQSLY